MRRTATGLVLTVLAGLSASTTGAQSLRIGDAVRVDPKARVQLDVRESESDGDVDIDWPADVSASAAG